MSARPNNLWSSVANLCRLSRCVTAGDALKKRMPETTVQACRAVWRDARFGELILEAASTVVKDAQLSLNLGGNLGPDSPPRNRRSAT